MSKTDEPVVMICGRCATTDPVVDISIKKNCGKCNEQIWVTPESFKLAESRKATLLCEVCSLTALQSLKEKPTLQPLTRGQIDELKQSVRNGMH